MTRICTNDALIRRYAPRILASSHKVAQDSTKAMVKQLIAALDTEPIQVLEEINLMNEHLHLDDIYKILHDYDINHVRVNSTLVLDILAWYMRLAFEWYDGSKKSFDSIERMDFLNMASVYNYPVLNSRLMDALNDISCSVNIMVSHDCDDPDLLNEYPILAEIFKPMFDWTYDSRFYQEAIMSLPTFVATTLNYPLMEKFALPSRPLDNLLEIYFYSLSEGARGGIYVFARSLSAKIHQHAPSLSLETIIAIVGRYYINMYMITFVKQLNAAHVEDFDNANVSDGGSK